MNKNVLRANIIGGMDNYIRDVIGDDDITEYWLTMGMPDGETEEMLMSDVEDDTTFFEWCECFYKCLKYDREH